MAMSIRQYTSVGYNAQALTSPITASMPSGAPIAGNALVLVYGGINVDGSGNSIAITGVTGNGLWTGGTGGNQGVGGSNWENCEAWYILDCTSTTANIVITTSHNSSSCYSSFTVFEVVPDSGYTFTSADGSGGTVEYGSYQNPMSASVTTSGAEDFVWNSFIGNGGGQVNPGAPWISGTYILNATPNTYTASYGNPGGSFEYGIVSVFAITETFTGSVTVPVNIAVAGSMQTRYVNVIKARKSI